ncbi:MAG: low molecular weight protein-tyrosine-phosphatase [Kofleriaceae bacterium]
MRICFVCLGNICRSPTAEGVMRVLVEKAGLAERVVLDSAGTGAYHVGEAPDPRTREAAKRRGYALEHRAWQFTANDFARFDLVLAMDAQNLRHLRGLARGRGHDVRLFRSFDPSAGDGAEVPDPWYGGEDGFREVLDQCERACEGLVAYVREQLAEPRAP